MYERRHHYQHLPAFALASVHEMGKGRDMSTPNDPMYPGMTHIGMTIRQRFVMAAMQGLCARSSGLGFSETIKSAIEIADAALAEEAKTRGEA